MKKALNTLYAALLTTLVGVGVLMPSAVSAQGTSQQDQNTTGSNSLQATEENQQNNSEPIDTDCESDQLDKDNCKIVKYLVNGINFLTAVAGMVIVFSIMVAGYQYMTARDNSGQIQQARTRIIWTLVALGIMIFMYGFLNWLVPGGVL